MRAILNKIGGKMKKTRCIDCLNCINLYVDWQRSLRNKCIKIKDIKCLSSEKRYCEKFEARKNKVILKVLIDKLLDN